MKRTLSAISLLVLVSMLLAACGGGAAGGGVIKIATQSPLSGGQSAIGVDIKNGAELALEQLKGPLEEMGFTVQLAAYDDQANPDNGVANAKQIVSDPAILCVVGHYNSGVQIPSSEEYHSAGLANVSPANTNPRVTTAATSRSTGSWVAMTSRVWWRQTSPPRRASRASTSCTTRPPTARALPSSSSRKPKPRACRCSGFEGTEEKANFDALLTPMLASNPDVVFFGGIYDQIAVFIKQAREKGYMGMFVSDDGFDSPEAVNIAGEAIVAGGGTYYSTVAGPAILYPGTAKFQTDFEAKYGAGPKPFAAQGYDSMAICLKAIEDAAKAAGNKMPERGAVATAVRALVDFPGITGTINFNSIGDLTTAKYFVIQVASPDPAKWNENPVAETLDIAPPQ